MRHLTKNQLLLELGCRPGLIPVAIDAGRRQLEWLDLETYHCYEGFFHKSLDRFTALKESQQRLSLVTCFTTDLNVLRDDRILVDSIYPTAVIFHAGRCGSTLLTKILSRDRTHLVFGEAPPHNEIWSVLTNHGERSIGDKDEDDKIYKHLVLAMGRRRLPAYEAHFVKFTSFNILCFDFINRVFPDVPAIFIYRELARIIASSQRNALPWLNSKSPTLLRLLSDAGGVVTDGNDEVAKVALALHALLAAGLNAGEKGAHYLNYDQLTPENLPAILKVLNVKVTTDMLGLMQAQFRFDAKVEDRVRGFTIDRSTPLQISFYDDGKLMQLYNQLAASELNIIPVNA